MNCIGTSPLSKSNFEYFDTLLSVCICSDTKVYIFYGDKWLRFTVNTHTHTHTHTRERHVIEVTIPSGVVSSVLQCGVVVDVMTVFPVLSDLSFHNSPLHLACVLLHALIYISPLLLGSAWHSNCIYANQLYSLPLQLPGSQSFAFPPSIINPF